MDGGKREIEFAPAMQGDAAIDAGGGKVQVEFDRLIEVGNRSIIAILFIPDEAAVAVDIGIRETESDRPI